MDCNDKTNHVVFKFGDIARVATGICRGGIRLIIQSDDGDFIAVNKDNTICASEFAEDNSYDLQKMFDTGYYEVIYNVFE